ncbi:integral membrane protein 2B isoform X1 [Paramormyrops kingsleyae]|uniref:integral membrane protein 2B isoform X1 n=1 Tax=Paramormyrops kingsleyae TaxID=1676925 RepID=UPI000CD62D3B|nr:integral membrane protein 2B isoform X1 [Paramormyrops kingsleyae]
MVKVSFNSALGQKDPKKEEDKNEALIPDETDLENGVRVRQQSKAWCWCLCLGLALMLAGVVVGGAYLYREFLMQACGTDSTMEPQVFVCGVGYVEKDFMIEDEEPIPPQRWIQESIRVLEDDEVEFINVPVPEFTDSDPADIVHDFRRNLTAYLDLSLNKCYVIPLNTSIVLPPRNFVDLLVKIKAGTYLPQSYLIHEQMMVTERLDNVDQLGYFIYGLCRGKETYRLERRDTIIGMQKREALTCHKIFHFENRFVVETEICEQ